MLFLGKENIFKCLVAFQKTLWKIFSGVWLCCWKYHRRHIFYLLLTFSQLPNKYIISFLNPKTQIKPRKKIHNPVKLREEGREIGDWVRREARSWRRRDRAARCCDYDQREGEITIGDDESGSRTIGFRVWREWSVFGGSMLGCNDLADGAIGTIRVWDGAIEWVFWVWRMGLGIARRTSSVLGFLGSSESVSGFGLFFLSLSLSLRAGTISLSLSSLSVF